MTKKDRYELYTRISKYFEDISKLVFAGVVLTSIMKEEINFWWLLGSGGLVVIVTAYIAYKTYAKSRNYKN